MTGLVVASYNVHGGVDGWGRPFDVVEACRLVDADVLVLQESWTPDEGPSVADRLSAALGYAALEVPLARGRIVSPTTELGPRWGPPLWRRSPYGLRLVGRRSSGRRPPGARWRVEDGHWALAVLTRPAVAAHWTVELDQLAGDPARRVALVVEVDPADGRDRVRVAGTHFAHISQGSPRHLATLRRALSPEGPAVLAGDMNMWGPPLTLAMPGWRRAVRGRTWPTWMVRPIAQSDHLLVTRSVRVAGGEVVRVPGSDHFPVRARLVT